MAASDGEAYDARATTRSVVEGSGTAPPPALMAGLAFVATYCVIAGQASAVQSASSP
jgi:hypothetical protein